MGSSLICMFFALDFEDWSLCGAEAFVLLKVYSFMSSRLFICFIILWLILLLGVFCSPHSVHRAHAGESEKVLREAFSEASSHAMLGKPSVIFIDEIDALCPRRDFRYVDENVDVFFTSPFDVWTFELHFLLICVAKKLIA